MNATQSRPIAFASPFWILLKLYDVREGKVSMFPCREMNKLSWKMWLRLTRSLTQAGHVGIKVMKVYLLVGRPHRKVLYDQ